MRRVTRFLDPSATSGASGDAAGSVAEQAVNRRGELACIEGRGEHTALVSPDDLGKPTHAERRHRRLAR